MNIEEEIEKLKYQINILKSTVDVDDYPIESLILEFDWDEQDLNDAHDIFEEYNNKLENKEPTLSWSMFESALEQRFNITYQTVKIIVISFYRNHQWMEVCYRYAKQHVCVEFHSLINDYEQNI